VLGGMRTPTRIYHGTPCRSSPVFVSRRSFVSLPGSTCFTQLTIQQHHFADTAYHGRNDDRITFATTSPTIYHGRYHQQRCSRNGTLCSPRAQSPAFCRDYSRSGRKETNVAPNCGTKILTLSKAISSVEFEPY
jgi:hypothetical protein